MMGEKKSIAPRGGELIFIIFVVFFCLNYRSISFGFPRARCAAAGAHRSRRTAGKVPGKRADEKGNTQELGKKCNKRTAERIKNNGQ